MIALKIAAGEIEADLRYGDPASRSDRFIRELGNDRWREAVADMKWRYAKWRTRWQPVHLWATEIVVNLPGTTTARTCSSHCADLLFNSAP
jgi:hypothetical protein